MRFNLKHMFITVFAVSAVVAAGIYITSPTHIASFDCGNGRYLHVYEDSELSGGPLLYDVEVDYKIVTPKYSTSLYAFFDDRSNVESSFRIVMDENQRFVALFCMEKPIAIFDFKTQTNLEIPLADNVVLNDFRRQLEL